MLVEATHVNGPFHDEAVATDMEGTAAADDRHNAQVNARRIRAIDHKLRLAGTPALVEGREVHERKSTARLTL